MPVIRFLNPGRDSGMVSAYSKTVILDVMKIAGVAQVTVTSTARTAHDQARIMLENIERHGVAHQKRLYGANGDKVIDVYDTLKKQGKSRTEIIAGMVEKINALGPGRVSRHAADPKKLNVIDIAPSSIGLAFRKQFKSAVEADSRISKFLFPPGDPAYHLEIPQP